MAKLDERDDILSEILGVCLRIDDLAVSIYQRFADDAPDSEQKEFWENLSVEEKDHVGLWEKMLVLGDLRLLPQVFDQPFAIRDKLSGILTRCRERFDDYCRNPDPHGAFLVAIELEFQMLHEAFLSLIDFYNQLTESDVTPLDYHQHVMEFIAGTRRFNGDNRDLILLMQSMEAMYDNVQALVSLGRTDSLTGLPNRRSFLTSVTTLAHLTQRNNETIALLLVDVDNLKRINDEQGFAVGDRLLRHLAAKLTEDVRQSDLMGRYDGDCFAIALSRANVKSIPKVAETIRRRVEVESLALRIPVSVSIGAVYGKFRRVVASHLPMLMQEAEENLRKAKNIGVNQTVISGLSTRGIVKPT